MSTGDVPLIRRVIIADADPRWPSFARRLGHEIRAACADHVLDVQHVGSTAVPGIAAKPIIDLMPALRRFEDGFACAEPMRMLGYESRGEYGVAGRHYFSRTASDDTPAAHVHMFEAESAPYRAHLLFRDYLRAHPAEARAYEQLKRRLAARLPRDAYTEAKTPFIEEALGRARAWDAAGRSPAW